MFDNKKMKTCGRPAGRKKTAKIEIVIEPEVKKVFMELLHTEGKTASVEICSWIREYIKNKSEGNKDVKISDSI